jgi:hypothetical protein
VAGLLRGGWDFVQTGTVPIVEAVLKGEDAVILLRPFALQGHIVIMTHPRITRLDQLNGKTVGVLSDPYSGQTGVIARLTVERAGAAATYVGLGTHLCGSDCGRNPCWRFAGRFSISRIRSKSLELL